MKWISFDALRTVKLPHIQYIKPEHFQRYRHDIQTADWLLFPQYWQLGALCFSQKKRIFPSFSSYFLGHDKVEMTRAFESCVPANTPWTIIEANTERQADWVWDQMPLPFVAKVPKSSMGYGVFLIENRSQWQAYLDKTNVIYVQERLPIDRDLRIIIIGFKVVAAYWRVQSGDGFHNNISQGGQAVTGIIPQAAIDLAMKVARDLNIDHAGFDIAMVDNHPYIFEFNRLFGNTGIPGLEQMVTDAIQEYLESAEKPQDPDHPTPNLPHAI